LVFCKRVTPTKNGAASALGFTPLPSLYWPILLLTLFGYTALTQTIKMSLLRKHWI
jgi:P-type Mg2+ transporter